MREDRYILTDNCKSIKVFEKMKNQIQNVTEPVTEVW